MLDTGSAEGWRVQIDKPVCTARIEIWLYRLSPRGDTEIMGPDGQLRRLLQGAARPPEWQPTLSLSGADSKQIMYALAYALEEEGIEVSDNHHLQSRLDAQTAHLNDLRMLLKLNKPSGE